MERFGMGVYRPMYEKVTTQVDDIYEYYKEHSFEVPKLNLYHATTEGREKTRKRLAGLDLVLADAEDRFGMFGDRSYQRNRAAPAV